MAEKILIVDDDIDSLKLIGLMLQRHGYEVIAANSGGQALQKVEGDIPNLIILDVMMPDMNGLEVARRLRANPRTANVPIIMFTAKTLIDDKVKGFEAGADDYLTKPTHPAELASRVKAILARNTPAAGGAAPPAAQNRQQRALSIGVLGAKGGVGTTTVALNVAASSFMQANEPTVMADFRLGVGSLGLQLGFGRAQSMARLLTKAPTDISPQVVEAELSNHQSGLRALVSSANPREGQLNYSDDTAIAIVRALRNIGRVNVYDLGHGLTRTTAKLITEVDRLIVVVEPNGVSLMMGRELVREIDNAGGGGRISVVVVNRSQSNLQTPWHEVENMLGREVRAIISAAPELAFQAIENATPMVMLQPNAIVSGQFMKLAEGMKTRIKSLANG